ncbi:MAG: hypothetical protein M3R55_16115 [Acidobacteriota bacterium]|nr:hypothetical protein [Acidobacteriota bacterium]
MRFLRPFTAFASRPKVIFVCGLILMATSLYDLGETVYTFAEGAQAEHGTLVYGVLVMLKSLNDAEEGIKHLGDATFRET